MAGTWTTLFLFTSLLTGILHAQQDLLDLAQSLKDQGKWRDAEILYQTIQARYPQTIWAQYAQLGLAELQIVQGDTHQAIQNLKKLLRASEEIRKQALQLLTHVGPDSDRAEAYLRLALEFPRDPGRVNHLLQVAQLFEASGNLSKALRAWKILAADTPSKHATYQLQIAQLYLKTGNPARAQVLSQRSDVPEAKRLHAQALLARGDTASAYALLLETDDLKSRALLCRLALNLRDVSVLESIAPLLPDTGTPFAPLKVQAGLLLQDTTLLASAVQHLKDPRLRIRALLQIGAIEQALHILDSLGTPQEFSDLWCQALLQSGRPLEAWKRWQKGKVSRRLSFTLAQALDLDGLHQEALEIWEDLWKDPGQGTDWAPKEQIGQALLADLSYTGQGNTPLAHEVEASLREIGLPVRKPASPSQIQNLLLEIAKGLPLSVGLQELLDAGQYRLVIDLLKETPRDGAIRGFLAQAYLQAFQEKGDTVFLDSVRALIQAGSTDPWTRAMAFRWIAPMSLPTIDPNLLTSDQRIQYVQWLIETHQADHALTLLRQDPELAADSHLVFRVYLAAGQIDSAYRYLDFQRPDDVLALAETLWQKDQPNLVLPLVQRVQKPGFALDLEARRLEVLALQRLGQWEDLIPVAERTVQAYGPTPDVVQALAEAWLPQDPWRALKWAYQPNTPEARRLRARALLALNQLTWARRYVEDEPRVQFVLALQNRDLQALEGIPIPMDTTLVEAYLRLLEESGDTLRARNLVNILVGKGWASPDFFTRIRAELWITRGQLGLATTLLSQIQDPIQRAKLQYRLGLSFMKAGELDSAKSLFFKTIQWGDPETRGYAAFKLASIFFQEGRYKEAREYYQMSLDLVQNDPSLRTRALYNLAVCQKRLKDLEGARRAYERLIQDYPETEDALDAQYSLGLLLLDLAQPEEAKAVLESLEGELRETAQEAELQYWLGQAAAQAGNLEEALQHYRRLYLFHPDAGQWVTTAQAEAAKLWVALGRIERAKALYQILLRTLPSGDPLRRQLRQEYEQLKRLSPSSGQDSG